MAMNRDLELRLRCASEYSMKLTDEMFFLSDLSQARSKRQNVVETKIASRVAASIRSRIKLSRGRCPLDVVGPCGRTQ